MKISTTIITFNEQDNIEQCIKSVQKFSDEILVIDSGSTDKTVEICKKMGANVIYNKFEGFVKQKKFAVDNAKYPWIFSIDADERATNELIEKIIEIKNNYDNFKQYKAFMVNRRNFYLGKWIKYGGWYPEKRIRFFHRDFAQWHGIDIHEKVVVKDKNLLYDLNIDIIHFPYKNISHHFKKINAYTSKIAEENIKKGKKVYFFQIIINPLFKFFRDYIIKKGFLMGKAGFIHAAMGSISVFMKYLKTYEKQRVDR